LGTHIAHLGAYLLLSIGNAIIQNLKIPQAQYFVSLLAVWLHVVHFGDALDAIPKLSVPHVISSLWTLCLEHVPSLSRCYLQLQILGLLLHLAGELGIALG
jgi:hypothetical protein